MEYTIYKHTSPSGKVYIGITCQSLERRWMNGRGYKECPRFYNAILKYGWSNFRHEIISTGHTKQEAELLERFLILIYKSTNPSFGYNIENGGNIFGTHSDETKEKISKGNKGKNAGKKHSAEFCEKMRARNMGNQNPFYGQKHTEQQIKAWSELRKGQTAYFKGKHHTEEFKAWKSIQMKEKYSNGKNPRSKPVVRIYDHHIIERYPSLRAAADSCGCSVSKLFKKVHDSMDEEWRYE